MLLSVISSAVSASILLVLYRRYGQKGSYWFAMGIAGLGCFVLEILIYRYRLMVVPIISRKISEEILFFSNILALAASLLITIAMPRLAKLQSGIGHEGLWRAFEWGLPALTFVLGLAFLFQIGGRLIILSLQVLFFTSIIFSLAVLGIGSAQRGNTGNKRVLWLVNSSTD